MALPDGPRYVLFLVSFPLVLPPGFPVRASTVERPLAVRGNPHSGLGGVQLPARCHSCAHTTHQCPDPASCGGARNQRPPAASSYLVRACRSPREVQQCSRIPRHPRDAVTKGSTLCPTSHCELTLLSAEDGVINNNNNTKGGSSTSGIFHGPCTLTGLRLLADPPGVECPNLHLWRRNSDIGRLNCLSEVTSGFEPNPLLLVPCPQSLHNVAFVLYKQWNLPRISQTYRTKCII